MTAPLTSTTDDEPFVHPAAADIRLVALVPMRATDLAVACGKAWAQISANRAISPDTLDEIRQQHAEIGTLLADYDAACRRRT